MKSFTCNFRVKGQITGDSFHSINSDLVLDLYDITNVPSTRLEGAV